jgi:hypothetical protein
VRAELEATRAELEARPPEPETRAELAHSIRENEGQESRARSISRVGGCGFEDDGNALAVEDAVSGGSCRIGYGPRVVMVPVIAASIAA